MCFSLFGGGNEGSSRDTSRPAPERSPDRSQASADLTEKKQRAAALKNNTVLTSPLGDLTEANTSRKTILG